MNVDYIIFYEHASRELEADIRLKLELDKFGFKGVVLPIHYNRYINVLKYNPKIIILPFLYKFNDSHFIRYFRIMKPSIVIINMHSEQIGTTDSQKRMMPLDEKSKRVFHFVWGKHFKNLLIQQGVSKDSIFAYGSIRNDLLFQYDNIDKNDKSILIPTSFSMTFVDKKYIESAIKKRNINREIFMKGLSFRFKSRNKFFRIIYELSIKKPKYTIKLCPHPYVDLKEYTYKFCEINNIKKLPHNVLVERNGSIAKAMSDCEFIIVWHSTSILEAYIMKKKILQLAPIDFPVDEQLQYMKYIPIGKNVNDCVTFLENKSFHNLDLDEYIKDIYGQLDGKASTRIANKIKEFIINYSEIEGNKLAIFNLKIKLLFKSLYVDLVKNILRKSKLLDKIFPTYKGIMEDFKEVR